MQLTEMLLLLVDRESEATQESCKSLLAFECSVDVVEIYSRRFSLTCGCGRDLIGFGLADSNLDKSLVRLEQCVAHVA